MSANVIRMADRQRVAQTVDTAAKDAAPPNGPWVCWRFKAALDDMMQLTGPEELAYRRILDMIWGSGDALADEDRVMAAATKAGRQWKAVKAALIRKGKIQVAGGFIRNGRATATWIETATYRAQKSAAVSVRHQRAKALKENETTNTGVATSEPTCDATRVQETPSLREGSTGIPRGIPGAPGGAPTTDQPLTAAEQDEALRRSMWKEARTIFGQIAAALPSKEPGQLMGSLVSAEGGGLEAATRALHILRDVQARILAQKLPGYSMADDPEARADVVRCYLRRIIDDTKKGLRRPKGSASGTAPPDAVPNTDPTKERFAASKVMARMRALQQAAMKETS